MSARCELTQLLSLRWGGLATRRAVLCVSLLLLLRLKCHFVVRCSCAKESVSSGKRNLGCALRENYTISTPPLRKLYNHRLTRQHGDFCGEDKAPIWQNWSEEVALLCCVWTALLSLALGLMQKAGVQ